MIKKKVLVVYFSATGTAKSAAKKVKKATDGTLYQIKAAKPYTYADLSYDNDDFQANTEQQTWPLLHRLVPSPCIFPHILQEFP